MHKTQLEVIIWCFIYWCTFCSALSSFYFGFSLSGKVLGSFIVVSWLFTSVEPNLSAPLIKDHYLCPRRYIHVCFNHCKSLLTSVIQWQSANKKINHFYSLPFGQAEAGSTKTRNPETETESRKRKQKRNTESVKEGSKQSI